MSILTPQEKIIFHRRKGFMVLAVALLLLLFGVGWYFWIGPEQRDAEPGTWHDALSVVYYEMFGITKGALVFAALSLFVATRSIHHFSNAAKARSELK